MNQLRHENGFVSCKAFGSKLPARHFGSKFSLQTFWSKFPLQAFGSGTPFFGVNLAVEKEGQIREGDTVFAPAT